MLGSTTSYPLATLSKAQGDLLSPDKGKFTLYTLELHNRPDNRLTPDFITKSILPALDDVERDWRESAKAGNGAAALITHGPRDADKFYSNGLDLSLAMSTPMFFPRILNALLSKMLLFPIPTIAALNGHTFAAGFTLALAHDFRVVKSIRLLMCMNEIDFGATIPVGMMAILKSKLPNNPVVHRRVLLQGERITGQEGMAMGIVDELGKDGHEVVAKAQEIAARNAGKARHAAWGLIKGGLYRDAVAEMATDRGNDGLSAPAPKL